MSSTDKGWIAKQISSAKRGLSEQSTQRRENVQMTGTVKRVYVSISSSQNRTKSSSNKK